MSDGNRKRIYFGFLFPLLQQYWFFCHEYENHTLNFGQFRILQSRVFEKIYQEWNQFKWDEKGLDWICSCIHQKLCIVDPSKFDSNPIAYVDHLKNYHFLESIN